MKEIKLRIYDKNNLIAKMSYGKAEWFDDMLGFRFDHFDSEPEDMVLMQYTGFKDDDGKDIYEGDVVKCTDGEGKVSELNSDTGIGQIEWSKEWGFWNISNIENGLGDIIRNGFVEIIGNIYENPELLEVE